MSSPQPRQAVVIIHGIGEQRPMDTLRSFVGAARPGATSGKAFSKPDAISPTLELRRMAVPGDDLGREWQPGDWVATDFYELYWAHLMTGTSWRQVTAWAWAMLCRWPGAVPRRLIVPWAMSWILVLGSVVTYVVIARQGGMNVAWGSLLVILGGLALWCLKSYGSYFGLEYVGDAARYLSPTPVNVGVRQAIRTAAIDLLEGLHDDPTWRRYHRIILVGHSLGSVIGYDALTHLWQRRHHPSDTEPLQRMEQPILEQYGRALEDPTSMTGTPRELQSALWREQRDLGIRWKITDFVTLGSPLAHAAFLMAKNEQDLKERVRDREYPSCPPQAHDGRDRQYGETLLTAKTDEPTCPAKLLHHAAPFACTRWTNLYFDNDFIGGPITHLGEWIDNKLVPPDGLFPHTHYWRDNVDLGLLRAALDLQEWWRTKENTTTALSAQQRDSASIQKRSNKL